MRAFLHRTYSFVSVHVGVVAAVVGDVALFRSSCLADVGIPPSHCPDAFDIPECFLGVVDRIPS